MRLALIAALLMMGACHRAPAPAAHQVRRIVSLAPSSTEIVYALGAGDRVVGVDQYSDWPPEAAKVARVGSDLAPSVERIMALRPDVVFIATSANSRELPLELERLGIRVVISKIDSLDDLWRDIVASGDAIGTHDAATALVDQLRARIAATHARVAALAPTKALVVVWADPLTVIGGHSFVDDEIRVAGGDNIAGDSPQPYPQYSVERMLARAPEVIVVGSHKGGPTLAPLTAHTSLPAVKNGRVHAVDGDLLFRPGPRLVDGIELLSRLLHP
ncbi:MAG: cobalamin-binding protein [bacterium]|nr:cobalamin-binding protein [bacterium]